MSDTNTTATVAPADAVSGMAGHVLAPAATRTRRDGAGEGRGLREPAPHLAGFAYHAYAVGGLS
ncbi:hypothetical protein [Streptomyces sp. NPDC018947]|uniref:hypothetical protein n=1 Tax=Streptomyces sp. NPDC018947 TaxID=3365054 RepID=UPI00378A74C4